MLAFALEYQPPRKLNAVIRSRCVIAIGLLDVSVLQAQTRGDIYVPEQIGVIPFGPVEQRCLGLVGHKVQYVI